MFYILRTVLLLFLALITFGCERRSTSEEAQNEYLFSIESDSILQDQTYIFIFDDSDAFVTYISYDSARSFISTLELSSGSYTAVTLTNIDFELLELIDTEGLFLSEFLELIEDEALFELSGIGITEFETSETGSINEINISIVDEITDLYFPCTLLTIALPLEALLDYSESRVLTSDASLQLRTTIELLRDGSSTFKQSYFLGEQDDESNYTKEFFLREGDYNILVWCDYVESLDTDYHYNTSDLSNIQILSSDQYTANSDYRDAFAGSSTISVASEGNTSEYIELYRPTAKYTIVSTDVENYNKNREKNGYSDIADLQIEVQYNGYFPSAYSVSTNKLTNSTLGYAYNSTSSDIGEESVTIAKDYVLVANNGQSSVTLSIIVSDGATGEIVNEFSSITVEYKAGYHTTVTGNFLTQNSGGFTLEQEWDGSYNITF